MNPQSPMSEGRIPRPEIPLYTDKKLFKVRTFSRLNGSTHQKQSSPIFHQYLCRLLPKQNNNKLKLKQLIVLTSDCSVLWLKYVRTGMHVITEAHNTASTSHKCHWHVFRSQSIHTLTQLFSHSIASLSFYRQCIENIVG